MIPFQPAEEFLVAVQRRYRISETIEARGLKGRIVEQISHEDYREVWAYRGFNSEAISLNPQYYYRCVKLADERTSHSNLSDSLDSTTKKVLGDKPPLSTETVPTEPLRGDQESA